MLAIIYRWLFFVAIFVVTGCASSPRYEMDDATREHPATKRFIEFAKAAKANESYRPLLPDFYTPKTQKQILELQGWYRVAYTAAYHFLNLGHCDSIRLKKLGLNRAQIDCVGELLVKSFIIPERIEAGHLRVFMRKTNDQWYFERAGYVHIETVFEPSTFVNRGLKFRSDLEPKNKK